MNGIDRAVISPALNPLAECIPFPIVDRIEREARYEYGQISIGQEVDLRKGIVGGEYETKSHSVEVAQNVSERRLESLPQSLRLYESLHSLPCPLLRWDLVPVGEPER